MQSQTYSSPEASIGDIEIEDPKSNTPGISEKIASEIKKQLHQAIEEIKLEVLSHVKIEITTLVKELLNAAKEELEKKKDISMGN